MPTMNTSTGLGCPLVSRWLQFQAHVQIFPVTDSFTGKKAAV